MKNMFLSVAWPIWVLFLVSSLFFVLYPQIDITVTSFFYSEAEGFFLKPTWWVTLLYDSVKFVIIVTVLVSIALWLWNRYWAKAIGTMDGKKVGFLLLVLALGPGLIVNWVFKENWGRARPAHIEIFGGDKKFVPAYVFSDQCETNCSFSSGHASGAYFVIALALLARRHQSFWMTLAIVYGSAVGLARIVAGGHFFSDVVVSFFVVYIVAKMLHYRMFEAESDGKSAA